MMRALYTAASGMLAQQLNIDNIAKNLANVGVTGYKKTDINFQDLLCAHKGFAQVGLGVKEGETYKVFTAGKPQRTGQKLHAYLSDPKMFFQVMLPEGGTVYQRTGAFTLKYDPVRQRNTLVTQAGYLTGIEFSTDITDIEICPDGTVKGTSIKDATPKVLGHLKVARFLNPTDSLRAVASDLYVLNNDSIKPETGMPGEKGWVALSPGFLESSNVAVVEGMMSIVQAQQVFQMNQKVAQVADEMMRMANQLKKA